MSDETTQPASEPTKPSAKTAARKTVDKTAPADTRVAKIKTLVPEVKAKGFTLGKGQTVSGVPLAHAEYLQKRGEVQVLEVA